MIDYAALKAEIVSDPQAFGYAAAWTAGEDWKVADLLNQVRAIQINRGKIDGSEIVAATTPSEFLALSAANQNLYIAITGASGGVDVSSALTRSAFAAMFANGTATRAALVALANRPGSRAEQLFGQGVSHFDVAKARAA